MAPYREIVACKVCETRVTVTATRKAQGSVKAVKGGLSVLCPICESTLPLESVSDIDSSTLDVLGFECKPGAPKPKYLSKVAPRGHRRHDGAAVELVGVRVQAEGLKVMPQYEARNGRSG